MANLTDLGFLKGIIAETIVSTYNKEGKPNAAPMGVIMEDEQHLAIFLFNSSATYTNIKANSCAVVNLTSNIEVFYKTTFKDANPDGKPPLEWFEKATGINAPKLRLAEVSIEVSLRTLIPLNENKTRAVFEVKVVHTKKTYPQVWCRAQSQTLEAIIHATRIRVFLNDKIELEKVQHLLEMINECNTIVNRVAPNSIYSVTMSDLIRRVHSWQGQK